MDRDDGDFVPTISPPSHVRVVDTAKRLDNKGKEYVAYRMRVTREDGAVEFLDQRYAAYAELHSALTKDGLGGGAGAVPLPGKKWFGMNEQDIEDRRVGLQAWLDDVLADESVRNSCHIESFFDAPGRYDWPCKLHEVDVGEHDPPHLSSAVETWRFGAHLTVEDREFSFFACFYRTVSRVNPETSKVEYVHAVVSAFIDVEAGTFHGSTILDPGAPQMLMAMLTRTTLMDHTLVAAYQEVLARGAMPLPDRLSDVAATCDTRKLSLKLGGNRLEKLPDGVYSVTISHPSGRGCELKFKPAAHKPAVRHGADGVLKGTDGEDLYTYFMPRLEVSGWLSLDPDGGGKLPVEKDESFSGWYEHGFGGKPLDPKLASSFSGERAKQSDDEAESDQGSSDEDEGKQMQVSGPPSYVQDEPRSCASTSCRVHLDNGDDVAAFVTYDMSNGAVVDGGCTIVDPQGKRAWYSVDFMLLEGSNLWRSTRTFQEVPTTWHLSVPEAQLDLTLDSAFADQEAITLLSQPSFWEGRVSARGDLAGIDVAGRGLVLRSGFGTLCSLDRFFLTVGNVARDSIKQLLPDKLSTSHARALIGVAAVDMAGLRTDRFEESVIRPIRALSDCEGPSWRSFCLLASCDAVGGDSRAFSDWLAMPELMHIASMVIADGAKGGHGAAQRLNAGCMCYSLVQRLLEKVELPLHLKADVYENFFTAMRAGHAGQGMNLAGVSELLPDVIASGDVTELEAAVLCNYRLQTAVPASCFSRMGALAGEGQQLEVDALGEFFRLTCLGFQMASDVAAYKSGGDCGKCMTMPVVKALARLKSRPERQQLVKQAMQGGGGGGRSLKENIDRADGFTATMAQAIGLVEKGWQQIASPTVLPDSYHKIMLRAFSFYLVKS